MKPGTTSTSCAPTLAGSGDIVSVGQGLLGPLARFESRCLGFVIGVLGWQIALLLALLWGIFDVAVYMAIHFAGCFTLATLLVCWHTTPIRSARSAALQIVAWSVLAGPFGAFVAAALSLRPAQTRVVAMRRNDVEALRVDCSEIEHVEGLHQALLDGRMRLDGARHIRPLMDIIAEGSQSEKLEALSVVYKRYDADLSAVLKRALQDPDPSVRVLAATVMAKLHATFMRKIGDCQTAAAAMPNLVQSWRNTADARLAYAESGLLEASRARTEIESAISDLVRAAEIDRLDRETVNRLASARRLAVWMT